MRPKHVYTVRVFQLADQPKQAASELQFRKNLAEIKEARGFTLRDIAQMAGVSASVVQNWLSGSAPYDLIAVYKLAQELGVPFERLLFGEHRPVGSRARPQT